MVWLKNIYTRGYRDRHIIKMVTGKFEHLFLEPDIFTSCHYYFMITEKDNGSMRFKQNP
jgi:hypothetical protein